MLDSHRKSDHPINPVILNRWSPRSMSGESLHESEILSLFEAARWAPSSFNDQPWRFIYATKGTEHFSKFLDLLVEFNQSWACNAGLLGLVIARKHFEHNNKPSPTSSFDAGAAWENLCLEGCTRNLAVHGMAGFDYERAKKLCKIPDDYTLITMFAVGKRAPLEKLSPDLQKKEVPSGRKKVEELVFEGIFKE